MAGEVFNKPIPQEAMDYFNAKKLKIGFDYRDVWRAEHAFNFTVAKAMTQDILTDIQGALASAIAEGKTFQQFQKELRPLLEEKGWWGVQPMVDPLTGKTIDAQLGSPRRLKTIYDANIRTARAAGFWDRIQRTKDALPYLLYSLGPSARHRDAHVAISGTLLPADDPFWGIYFPPNGYGCKCWVRQISRAEYLELADDPNIDTESHPIQYENWINKRTGEVERVAKGVTPGWDTNPGLLRQVMLDKALLNKAYAGDAFVQSVLLSQIRQQAYSGWVDTVITAGQSTGAMMTVGVMSDVESGWLKNVKQIEPAEQLIVLEDRLLVGKKAQRHEADGNALSVEEWKAVPENLANPETVLFDVKNQSVLYVYGSGDKLAKLAVAIDFKLKAKAANTSGLPNKVNVIRSGFKVKIEDLTHHTKNGDYLIIKGELK